MWFRQGLHLLMVWFRQDLGLLSLWFSQGLGLLRVWFRQGLCLLSVWFRQISGLLRFGLDGVLVNSGFGFFSAKVHLLRNKNYLFKFLRKSPYLMVTLSKFMPINPTM